MAEYADAVTWDCPVNVSVSQTKEASGGMLLGKVALGAIDTTPTRMQTPDAVGCSQVYADAITREE